MVNLLLSYSEELKENWLEFQSMYSSFDTRDSIRFFGWLQRYDGKFHEKLATVIEIFLKIESYVKNSFRTSFSNGVLEGVNNKI